MSAKVQLSSLCQIIYTKDKILCKKPFCFPQFFYYPINLENCCADMKDVDIEKKSAFHFMRSEQLGFWEF